MRQSSHGHAGSRAPERKRGGGEASPRRRWPGLGVALGAAVLVGAAVAAAAVRSRRRQTWLDRLGNAAGWIS